jgi:hypothetical protein
MGVHPFYSTGQKIWDFRQIMKALTSEFAYNCLLESFPIMLQLETQPILVIILKLLGPKLMIDPWDGFNGVGVKLW